ncbi:MAG: hypothetical protein H0V66_09835 [Bdellovibrionales bacterium]|nr:hypothetical protein [Bdellovibrionales bacterium]
MFKVFVLGLLVSQSAMAGFVCSSGNNGHLNVVDIADGSVLVKLVTASDTKEFDGKLNLENSQTEGLYQTYDYDLQDSHQAASHLVVSITPRFGRGCGRACNKSMPETISAKLTTDNVVTFYGCLQTVD